MKKLARFLNSGSVNILFTSILLSLTVLCVTDIRTDAQVRSAPNVAPNPTFTYNASSNPGVSSYALTTDGVNFQIINVANGAIIAIQPVAGTTAIVINGQTGGTDTFTINF